MVHYLMCGAPCSSLTLLMFGREIRLGVWNGFLLGRVRSQAVPCRICGALDGDGHLFLECTFPPLVEIRENPEFQDLIRMFKAHWPRCLPWHGWLPMLSVVNGASPWAADASERAGNLVEVALGRYSSSLVAEWSPPGEFDEAEAASCMPDPTGRSKSGSNWRQTWALVGHTSRPRWTRKRMTKEKQKQDEEQQQEKTERRPGVAA